MRNKIFTSFQSTSHKIHINYKGKKYHLNQMSKVNITSNEIKSNLVTPDRQDAMNT